MKTTAFALSVLAASVHAQNQVTDISDAVDNTMLGKIKMWNCATCTMAFKGIDKLIDSSKFQTPIQKGAIKVC